ncbi:MAG: hypothetical protein EOP04_21840, partial [Proteobacteria bacterium]
MKRLIKNAAGGTMRLVPAFIALSLLTAASSRAQVSFGAGEAYGLSVNVSGIVAGIAGVDLNVGPTAYVSNSAPLPYSQDFVPVAVNVTTGAGIVTAGAVGSSVQSNVDGLPGPRFSVSSSSVDDLDLRLYAVIGDTLKIDAGTITSSASVFGGSTYSYTADSDIQNLSLIVLGSTLVIPAEAFTTPNYVFAAGLGINIIFNEQIVSGNTASGYNLEVNALRISFVDLGLANTDISGDIIVGHSF